MKILHSSAILAAGMVAAALASPSPLAAQADRAPVVQLVAAQPMYGVATAAQPAQRTGIVGVAAPVGPTVDAIAVHSAERQSLAVSDQDVTGPHVNRGLALTVAGIAAVGVGYAVKGGAGTAIAFGGGALALYGIYHWIK